jgi:hypothetical protein
LKGLYKLEELLLKAHKAEQSPYNSVNEYVDGVETYAKETTTILLRGIKSILGMNKNLKKSKEDGILIFKGKIQYSPKTGKPITIKEWIRLEEAIIKYLNIEKKELQRKISSDSYWLGSLLARMDKQQRLKVHAKDIDISEPDFNKVDFTNYDKDRIELADRFAGIYIQNVNDKTRSKIQQIILDGSRQHTNKGKVLQNLFDLEDDINRDWERVVRTEIPSNINDGIMTTLLRTSDEENIFMKGISAPTACPHCMRLVNEKVVVLVNKPIDSGMKTIDGKIYPAIWPGKSNFGRKPRDYWVANTIHPYCRCTWTEWYVELEEMINP